MRRDKRTLPSPQHSPTPHMQLRRPRALVWGLPACRGQIWAPLSNQVFLWGAPSSFPDSSSMANCPGLQIPGTPIFDLCVHPYEPHIQMTLLLLPCRAWLCWEHSPCVPVPPLLAVAPRGSATTPYPCHPPSPWPQGTLPACSTPETQIPE